MRPTDEVVNRAWRIAEWLARIAADRTALGAAAGLPAPLAGAPRPAEIA